MTYRIVNVEKEGLAILGAREEKSLERVHCMMSFDERYYREYQIVAGVDEVGRGPLAGPVYACALVLPHNADIKYVNDSKKLTPKRRKMINKMILENVVDYSIGIVNNVTVDEINILQATRKAMEQAVEGLKCKPDFVLVDGNDSHLRIKSGFEPVVRGDGKSFLIACASIVAKVARDNYMEEVHEIYPWYNFKQNKGYGTKEHIGAIYKYGLCPLHRRTFTTKFVK